MEKALTPIEQKTVVFYDDELTAVRADDGRIYAGVRQMCDALGLDAQGQRRRMERHAVLSKGLKGVDKLSTPGGSQSGYVLRADLVPLWLSGIRTSAVMRYVRSWSDFRRRRPQFCGKRFKTAVLQLTLYLTSC